MRRPILVGGIGLTVGLWFLDSLHHWASGIETVSVIAIAGVSLWGLRQPTRLRKASPVAEPVDRAAVKKALAEVNAVIQQLETEVVTPEGTFLPDWIVCLEAFKTQMTEIPKRLEAEGFHLAILGGQSTGKTTLAQILASQWLSLPTVPYPLHFQDTSALFGDAEAISVTSQVLETTQAADLVIFLTAGDLTEPEYRVLKQLGARQQRFLVAFNKQDQYLPADSDAVLQQIQQRLQGLLALEDVRAIATRPNPLKVRQHQIDGSLQEWLEQPEPDVQALTQRLTEILSQEGPQLRWATAVRLALALKATVRGELNQLRKARALPVIEQFQWIAAATAFANPVPALDLLATGAISAQMVIDLGAIYRQQFSLQQAQTVATTLAQLLVKLGLVELTTQTLATALKSNALTFVAGGTLQGVSAAYLTRLAGLSLIEYFQEQEFEIKPNAAQPLQLDQLGQKLRSLFQQNQQPALLQALIQQSIQRLLPTVPPAV